MCTPFTNNTDWLFSWSSLILFHISDPWISRASLTKFIPQYSKPDSDMLATDLLTSFSVLYFFVSFCSIFPDHRPKMPNFFLFQPSALNTRKPH